MKKKKLDEQSRPDFRNNPFKSLKGFVPPAHTPDKKKAAPPPKNAGQSEDDSELFLRAATGARRFEEDAFPAVEATARKKPVAADPLAANDDQLFLLAMKKIGTAVREDRPDDEIPGEQRRSSSSRMKQLKRGTIRISGELDLHGLLRDEAIARLGRFIAEAHSRGREAVLVITGKGINSPEGPVLQGAAAEWLRGRGKAMIAEFSPAPRDKGGSGAFVVFLRKK